MKQKLSFIFTIFLLLNSCKSSKNITDKKCPRHISKSIKGTSIDQFKYTLGKDTLSYNEVKFYCVYNTAFYTHKTMYDKFGKWDREIYANGERHPILLWENIKLFEKDSTLFTIATLGDESEKTIYASFMAYDNNGNDLLNDIIYKEKLVNYFKDLIHKSKPEKRDFYKIYWSMVDTKS
ncbi:hypothetical protein [Flagellimonas eckloniae]|uniref:Uncharacterized protein n=1 Tax=Flagellimonas eckloniae TaxID=346185 RepID=A0A0N8WFR5_9FLAO|nr:hypothetical protein [Allomuricauda eckloniae]KQC29435.1 hypothetical protein AAY42_05660 [Allomuricauda eckloniae]